MSRVIIILLFTLSLFISGMTGCKEKYSIPPGLEDKNYLVVEGFIDVGNDSTRIELSRTSPLDGGWGRMKEAGAQTWIESEGGETLPLMENEPGVYKGGPFVLDENSRYRLRIQTSNGKSYTSSFEEVKKTPDIDSITWGREENGVRIQVNTHDPENNSRFYSWQFEETWEFFSAYYSGYEYVNGQMIPRMNADELFRCWQHNVSRNILIGSSARLKEDIIHRAPLTFIENNSWKLSSLYSIRVKQSCLSKNAYEYFEKMKKSTESMGTIFDPMPTTDRGNIVCDTDPSEMVIGYVYASSVKVVRKFISRSDVGTWRFTMGCQVDTVENNRDNLETYFGSGGLIPIAPMGDAIITHYLGSSSHCMDCRFRGTNSKPDFWP